MSAVRIAENLDNLTDYRTDHLIAFIARVAEVELPDLPADNQLHWFVRFRPRSGRYSKLCGISSRGDSAGIVELILDREVDKVELAHTIAHECAHIRDLDHDAMEGDPRYDDEADGWREVYSWAADLPLERRQLDPILDWIALEEIGRLDREETP